MLPFYSYQRSPRRDSTTVLWPFFTHVTDREKKYAEWQTPWPLIVFARGEGKTTSRVWPFFSHAQNTNLESAFYLWPLYKLQPRCMPTRWIANAPGSCSSSIRISSRRTSKPAPAERRVDFWPLFTHRRELRRQHPPADLSLP